ncbi:MAG TPA: hypothetical protein VFM93_13065 [Candidatus Limnocylindria bacterium]|nr:hypothetical protein [Candidatus Limnocylindria bacterium]
MKTTNLTGWNRTIDHFVNLWAFNLDTNWIQWSDSAGFLQSGSSQSLGFHDRPFSTFYSENVAPGNGFAW